MATIIKWLDDPYLVVRFQRFFGVVPNENTAVHQGNGHISAVSSNGLVHHMNGNLQCNGINSGDHTKPKPENVIINHKNEENCGKQNMNDNLNGTSTMSEIKQRKVTDNTDENSLKGHKRTKSVAWDIVSNQERGIEDKWETDEYVIKNKPLYYIFNFGANLGNEIFYITFFPFWLWNIDGFVGRRVCIFWALFMYLGQVTKDLLKIPRPASPPVIRLEKLYALEYGMPSTHAMVGAGFPFSILLLTWERYVFPVEYGFVIALLWTTIVCCSRLYLGMHSVLDVIAGLVYVFSLMPLVFPLLDTVDEFLVKSPFSPFVVVLIPIFLGVYYPKLDRWSTARGDTTVILSVAAGVILGMWLSFQHGYLKPAPVPPPYNIIYPDMTWAWQLVARMVIGVLILVATRQIMKPLTFRLACLLFNKQPDEKNVYQNLCIELPYKFITYTAVAFNAVYLVPLVFRHLGIERPTYFTEM